MGMTFPTLQNPLEAVELTSATIATVLSITIALFAPREFDAPGLGRESIEIFPTSSLIVPLFNAREFVAI